MTFDEAKQKRYEINTRVDAASQKLQSFPKGPMGLTPDDVKMSDEYRVAKFEFDSAFSELRNFNGWFIKRFSKELRRERMIRK